MRMPVILILTAIAAACMFVAIGCGDDGNKANRQKIGAECAVVDDCDDKNDDTPALECILDFKGGYCGRADCTDSTECPEGSLCAVLDNANYCFLVCTDKAECNLNRTVDNESNCSSNIDPVEGGEEKLCIPPAG